MMNERSNSRSAHTPAFLNTSVWNFHAFHSLFLPDHEDPRRIMQLWTPQNLSLTV